MVGNYKGVASHPGRQPASQKPFPRLRLNHLIQLTREGAASGSEVSRGSGALEMGRWSCWGMMHVVHTPDASSPPNARSRRWGQCCGIFLGSVILSREGEKARTLERRVISLVDGLRKLLSAACTGGNLSCD